MIITVGNTKGGVGKSTVAVNLAASLAMRGRDVWLVDGDRQRTAQTAITNRLAAGREPGIPADLYADGQTLRLQVLQKRDKYQDIIIDAGGRDSASLRAALVLSDVVLIPFQPRSFDVWALADISTLVQEARSVRDGLKAYVFLNMADPSATSTDNADAIATVAEWPELQLLDAALVRRKAFANAAGQGLCVHEMQQRDIKACAELDALIAALS